MKGHSACVEMLLQAGADIHKQDNVSPFPPPPPSTLHLLHLQSHTNITCLITHYDFMDFYFNCHFFAIFRQFCCHFSPILACCWQYRMECLGHYLCMHVTKNIKIKANCKCIHISMNRNRVDLMIWQ